MDRFLLIQKEIEGVKHTAKEHLKHVSTAFSQSHEALRAEVDAKIKQLGQNVHVHQEQIRREFLSMQEGTYVELHEELSQVRQKNAQLEGENKDLRLRLALLDAKVDSVALSVHEMQKTVDDVQFSKSVIRHFP